MKYQWDKTKRRSNVRKHGVDFADCAKVFDGFTVTLEDQRSMYSERRFKTIGCLDGRLIPIIHTERSDVIRLISARKASTNEQILFQKTVGD